jgi:hypothetical protein
MAGASSWSAAMSGGTAAAPNLPSASLAACRTSGVPSPSALMSGPTAVFASGAMRPNVYAALRRTLSSVSASALMTSGAVSFAAGPIHPSVQIA